MFKIGDYITVRRQLFINKDEDSVYLITEVRSVGDKTLLSISPISNRNKTYLTLESDALPSTYVDIKKSRLDKIKEIFND